MKRGFFRTLVISNIMILLVAVLMAATLTHQYHSSMSKNAYEINRVILEQTRSTTDKIISTIDMLAINISMNQRINKMAHVAKFERDEYISESYDIIEELSKYIKTYFYLDSICLYYANSGSVITNNSRFLSVDDFLLFSSDAYWGKDEFWRLIAEGAQSKHMGSHMVSSPEQRTRKSVFTIVIPLTISSLNQSYGYAIINVNNDYIQDFASTNRIFDKSIILARNAQGNIMFQFGTADYFDAVKQINYTKPDKIMHLPFGNETLIVSQIPSEVNDWTYWSAIEESSFTRNLGATAVLFIAALLLISGTLLAVALAHRNANPVRKTLESIRRQFALSYNSYEFCETGPTQPHNEFDVIRSLAAQATTEYLTLSERLQHQLPILQANAVRSLLNGAYPAEGLEEELSSVNIYLPCRYCTVLIFHSNGSWMPPDRNLLHAQLAIAIERELSSLDQYPVKVYQSDMDGSRIAALLNSDLDFDLSGNTLHAACGTILDEFSAPLGRTITVAIGKSAESPAAVHQSWLTADRALQARLISAPGGITRYDSMEQSSAQYYYPIELENKLIESVRAGNAAEMHSIIDEIIMQNFGKTRPSTEVARCLLFSLLGTALRVGNALPARIDWLNAEGYRSILTLSSVQDVEVTIRGIFEDVCEEIMSMKSRNSDTLKQILRYIDENYRDQGLCLISVSEEVKLNPNYLSTYFKDHIGDSFSSYVSKLRVNRAEVLLKEQGISVDKIAEMVGYASSSVLIRNFKRYTGQTPGEFRKRAFL